MNPLRDDLMEAALPSVFTAEAANDPLMQRPEPASGWDPFDVWRTRVRDVQHGQHNPPTTPKD